MSQSQLYKASQGRNNNLHVSYIVLAVKHPDFSGETAIHVLINQILLLKVAIPKKKYQELKYREISQSSVPEVQTANQSP